ncbi:MULTISPECIES: 4-hydroxythreonine-4-phosphate dehydrogenase PdxA [Halomonadaceae]|uniref:4-hydroxythreonine-4-phosphate dehydrogenase n=2 Tax=Halomonadaceae TaxID=28256 RepID=A0A8H9IRK3_9GAMM|nr:MULTISPECIES: 4-hydroxythreonine-4-phosphate dehydrogenase PdxA [Halomonas]ATH76360.1 4-hydroxythreonine-4-phosphate dehydrogenase PdxA [Halomonas hydrothermalis]KHJ52370.1 4-hydroxythreonine-4-phosphate dehydrogenase [Halomonas hydrothermalis]GGW60978.1 4-hydroxythreonine-4-phosphate dehydrogenase 1 [Halomonas johnsoniae]GHD54120.1 4-hydroxythreonine-4-phosphate dehydrogenase 1 [Halomonas hamiltonii]
MSLPLLITTGEPAGIGPELTLMLAAQGRLNNTVAVGDPTLLAQRAALLALTVEIVVAEPGSQQVSSPGRLVVWPVALRAPATPGVLDPANAGYVLDTLQTAVDACLAGHAAAMVTAPLHKGVIIEGGYPHFTGHTEWLRDACGVDEVVMLLATDAALHATSPQWQGESDLRVALVTTHLPLRDVADAITGERIARISRLLVADLQRQFGIAQPRVAVCGLNPHAGEDGHLGREELEIITPTLQALRAEGLNVEGPFPADTLFTPRHLAGVDAVLAMYHDQGLAVLKYAGFGQAANITLGLPLVRTSVDHGTALDLAGRGIANPSSLGVAVALAQRLATQRASSQAAP